MTDKTNKEKKIRETKQSLKVKQQIQRGFDIANKWKEEQEDEQNE